MPDGFSQKDGPAKSASLVRCAIYTRKSTEEGLDQDFNSLQAQREAAEAYIHSQKEVGWKLLPQHYDDHVTVVPSLGKDADMPPAGLLAVHGVGSTVVFMLRQQYQELLGLASLSFHFE